MWSGPRNISTAMMRAWENRADCVVSDEPFYAAWLHATGADHPMRDAVIATGETDASRVAHLMSQGSPPVGSTSSKEVKIWYQKHMCQHWIQAAGYEWLRPLTHVFLIRDPLYVVQSYIKARQTFDVCAEDIGLPQQHHLFEIISEQSGWNPPVIDAEAFLNNPRKYLECLCHHLDIPANIDAMTYWPLGPRDSDGIWGSHWYERVWASTGFQTENRRARISRDTELERLHPKARAVVETCQPHFNFLRSFHLELT